MKTAFKMLVGRPEGKSPPGRTSRRWEGSIKMVLNEVYLEGVHWICLRIRAF
jgi:hypothetical protein